MTRILYLSDGVNAAAQPRSDSDDDGHALKAASLSHSVELFAESLKSLPQTASGDNLLRLAAFIAGKVHRQNSARTFANFRVNLQRRELLQLEVRRGELLSQAISKVMPEVSIPHADAVLAFRSHLIGSILIWLDSSDKDARRYILARTRDWLVLSRVTFQEEGVETLGASGAAPND